MGVLYLNEHLNCFNYNNENNSLIEQVRIVQGYQGDFTARSNVVIFIMKGKLNYTFKGSPSYEAIKGQVLFVASGNTFSYKAETVSSVLIFRIIGPMTLCRNYTIEKLYKEKMDGDEKGNTTDDEYKPTTRRFGVLEINARMWHFLEGISLCMGDGLKCCHWFEMKIEEFFLLLRAYYPKEDLRDFLYLVLSSDMAFSEHIRKRWKDFRTVNELAAFMHMTPKQFSVRFVQIFGKTPYRWMMERKAHIIHAEITSTNKQFKQIAIENGFTSDSLFSRFCKTTFGKTPSQIRENKIDPK